MATAAQTRQRKAEKQVREHGSQVMLDGTVLRRDEAIKYLATLKPVKPPRKQRSKYEGTFKVRQVKHHEHDDLTFGKLPEALKERIRNFNINLNGVQHDMHSGYADDLPVRIECQHYANNGTFFEVMRTFKGKPAKHNTPDYDGVTVQVAHLNDDRNGYTCLVENIEYPKLEALTADKERRRKKTHRERAAAKPAPKRAKRKAKPKRAKTTLISTREYGNVKVTLTKGVSGKYRCRAGRNAGSPCDADGEYILRVSGDENYSNRYCEKHQAQYFEMTCDHHQRVQEIDARHVAQTKAKAMLHAIPAPRMDADTHGDSETTSDTIETAEPAIAWKHNPIAKVLSRTPTHIDIIYANSNLSPAIFNHAFEHGIDTGNVREHEPHHYALA